MSSRDSEVTKARILSAAVTEFAEYGYAGARIDRVAAAAKANKSMIYVYFGSKNQLFDAVIDAAIGDLHRSVPFTPGDLPGYGARLFDFLVAHPVEIRIDAWRRLERPANTSLEREIFADKIAALDRVRPYSAAALDSADLLVAVLALAWSWVTVPVALRSLASEDVAIQRELVIQSIQTLCAGSFPRTAEPN
jgi:AcrR family transcriptional regulator